MTNKRVTEFKLSYNTMRAEVDIRSAPDRNIAEKSKVKDKPLT